MNCNILLISIGVLIIGIGIGIQYDAPYVNAYAIGAALITFGFLSAASKIKLL